MCDGTLRSDIDGHTEARWFALKPEGLALQNPLARMQSLQQGDSDGSKFKKNHKYCFA